MRCKLCKVVFVPTKFLQKCCSIEHSLEWIKLNPKIIKEASLKIERAKNKLNKEKLTNWKNRLQTEVQLLARLIDYGLPCLATGKLGQIHGGHVIAKGGNPQCRFNLHNIHRQCAQSNKFGNDSDKMWDGLIGEYGKEYHDKVKNLKSNPIPKYSNEVYHEFYKVAHKITLELSKDLKLRSPLERVELRKKYNKQINIYRDEF